MTQAAALGGAVTWNGRDRPIVLGALDEPAPDGSCVAFIEAAAVEGTAKDDPMLYEQVHGDCVDGMQVFHGVLTLMDVRDLDVGTHQLKQGSGGNLGRLGEVAEVSSCTFEGTAELTVDAAEGGSLPYPHLVSEDFRKSFHVHMAGSDTLGTCASTSPGFDIALAFEIASDYFESGPTHTCSSCGC